MTQVALERIASLQPPPFQNHAIHFAAQANSSEAARLDGQFQEDFMKVLSGNCIYLKNFLGRADDTTILNGLIQDLVRAQAVGEGGGDGVINGVNDNNNNIDVLSKVKKAVIQDTNKPNYAAMGSENNNNKRTSQQQQPRPITKEQAEGDE